VDGSLDHLGEFTYPGLGFLYVAGWIGYAGRSYVIANKAKDKPLDGEIIIDVPAALNIMFASAGWPLLAVRELQKGTLLEDDGTFLWGALVSVLESLPPCAYPSPAFLPPANITVSPR
jgi:hypothetical protein